MLGASCGSLFTDPCLHKRTCVHQNQGYGLADPECCILQARGDVDPVLRHLTKQVKCLATVPSPRIVLCHVRRPCFSIPGIPDVERPIICKSFPSNVRQPLLQSLTANQSERLMLVSEHAWRSAISLNRTGSCRSGLRQVLI